MIAFLTALAFEPARFLGNTHLANGYVDALARFVCAALVMILTIGALGVGVRRVPRYLTARS